MIKRLWKKLITIITGYQSCPMCGERTMYDDGGDYACDNCGVRVEKK